MSAFECVHSYNEKCVQSVLLFLLVFAWKCVRTYCNSTYTCVCCQRAHAGVWCALVCWVHAGMCVCRLVHFLTKVSPTLPLPTLFWCTTEGWKDKLHATCHLDDLFGKVHAPSSDATALARYVGHSKLHLEKPSCGKTRRMDVKFTCFTLPMVANLDVVL